MLRYIIILILYFFTIQTYANTLESLSWSTINITSWFIWNNFNWNSSSKEYNTPLGYYWNNYNEIHINKMENTIPIWYLWDYKKINPNWSKNWNPCILPEKIENLNIDIVNNDFNDSIELSWEKIINQENLTIYRIYPNYNKFNLDSHQFTFTDNNIENGKKYAYYLTHSNNCSTLNSNIVKIKYDVELSFHTDKNLIKNKYLSNHQIINILTQLELTPEEIFQRLYYLYPDLDINSFWDNGTVALLLLNVTGNLLITDKQIAFDIFQYLWLYRKNSHINEKIESSDFYKMLYFINKRSDFQEDILSNIDSVFSLDSTKLSQNIFEINSIKNQFKILSKDERKIITQCNTFLNCIDKEFYLQFKNSVKQNKQEINSGIKMEINTWSELLFHIIQMHWHQNTEFNIILSESFLYWEDMQDISFFEYQRFLLILQHSEFKDWIIKLWKYNNQIIHLYNQLEDKSRLYELLKKYISK